MSEPTENPNRAFIDAVRALADMLEARPMTCYCEASAGIFVHKKDEMLAIAKGLGNLDKVADKHSDYFKLVKRFSPTVYFQIMTNRDEVCERIVTKKLVEATPVQIIPASPEREVEVVEWKCPPSLLAEPAFIPGSRNPRSLGEEYGDPGVDIQQYLPGGND